jgi:hypothetical protein
MIVLLSLLAAKSILVYVGWTVGDGLALPRSSSIAIALGAVFSLGVGFGLMTLVFYSSRKDL